MRDSRMCLARGFGLLLGLSMVAAAAAPVRAQQGVLTGTVLDAETRQPIAQAQVQLRGGPPGVGALTNDQGVFRVTVPAGSYDVVVEYLGYVDAVYERATVAAGQTTDVQILLTSTALALDPVQVTVSRTQQGEKASEAPATVYGITAAEITERPATSFTEHLREAPGVDIITSGVSSSNVSVRGFNNIFSGSLHMLTDYRLAGVPSLRVNLMHYIPQVDEDVERMEVVLGPGSALYGPNTANGVLHILTKSPLASQGTSVTVGVGERSVLQTSARSAFLLGDDLGFKISGQYMQGREWNYSDLTEQVARDSADANPVRCVTDRVVRGLSPEEAVTACDRLGVRDFDMERWSVEARADYRFADDGLLVGTYGRNTSSGVELTGLGAGQTNDWVYQFFQARASKGRSFAQVYYNTSNAGDSYLILDGVSLVDESSLFVAQAQQGVAFADGRQELTGGVDYFRTRPDSRGTIYGSFEEEDDIDEWGVYLQSQTALTEQLDLVLAGRFDSHSLLPDDVWSPRAAVVYRPIEGQSFRFTYNRAFSTPTALNYFLDISGGLAPDPFGSLGYTRRAFGTGKEGWSLQNADGSLKGMKSPCNPNGIGEYIPSPDAATLWQLAVVCLRAQGVIDDATAAQLAMLNPTDQEVPPLLFDANTREFTAAAATRLEPVPPLSHSNTETFEVGWTGLIDGRVQIAADVYYMNKNDFGSPLIVQTPMLFLSGPELVAYLTPFVGAAQAAALGTAVAQFPLGVASTDEFGPGGADLVATYRNVGDLDVWGADLNVEAYLTSDWTVSASWSHISDDYFPIDNGAPIALNAPKDKGSLGVGYRNAVRGFNASARLRFTSSFPAESAGYVGTACITGGMGGIFEQECVDDSAIVDVTAGYRIPSTRATLQLSVSNVFDTAYRSFVGVPDIGRFAMIRARYDLF